MTFIQSTAVDTSKDFSSITIGLASPEMILARSYGETLKPETINYRSYKPEKDGLFCEKIFGPVKDYECHCGKYKGIRYRGIICDRCGVEVTRKKVRRDRMGHITLAVPVVHIWYLRSIPSKLSYLIGLSTRELERVIYYEAYLIITPGKSGREMLEIIDEFEYMELEQLYGFDSVSEEERDEEDFFYATMGGEAMKEILSRINLVQLKNELQEIAKTSKSKQKRGDALKRLRIVNIFIADAGKKKINKPEWMIVSILPVIPPELRPLVPLEGGRFAASDLNDLYRRIIIRNNRLKQLMEIKAPDVILRNEKRMLQESVDALFDNNRRKTAIRSGTRRPLKSISDMLRGKPGRFRQNLLGKRVDYSGRSVIVVGPELKLNECGLPKNMALELFKPHMIHELIARGYAQTPRGAKLMVENREPIVYKVLEYVVQDHPVLLNRAPTLHRLGVQAFQPVLVDGKAIHLHPLVCAAFNADFDGDQMAVHVPLSIEAQLEARTLMMATNNILSPANGEPVINPTQDVVLGLYAISREKINAKGEGSIFADLDEIYKALHFKKVEVRTKIQLRIKEKILNDVGEFEYRTRRVTTTVGRGLIWEIVPEGMPFSVVNCDMTKKNISKLIDYCYRNLGIKETVVLADQLMYLGFRSATKVGVSIGLEDMAVPKGKSPIIDSSEKEVKDIQDQYSSGLVTEGERYNKVVDIWSRANEQVAKVMMEGLGEEDTIDAEGNTVKEKSFNSIFMMADSGARGSAAQIRQLAGMRGLMAKPDGSIDATPNQ